MVVAREAIWLIRLAAYSILYHNILLVLHAVSRHFQVNAGEKLAESGDNIFLCSGITRMFKKLDVF